MTGRRTAAGGAADPTDPLQVARAVARRVDTKIEPRLADVERRTRKLAEGFAVLVQADDAKPSDGQQDWLRCRTPKDAQDMLRSVHRWLDECGVHLDVSPAPCWPWHPRAVVLLLAIARHYGSAYSGDSASAVSDFHTRYLSGLAGPVTKVLEQCNGPYHRHGEAWFGYDVGRVDSVAVWWATSREGLPPGLTPRDRMAAVG